MIERINPDTLHKNPAFTQVAVVAAAAKLVYVGGQNGVLPNGELVNEDVAAQSAQAMQNVIYALEAAGATLADVFKMTIYIVQGQSLQAAYAASQALQQMAPPIVTVILVAGLARPGALVEIEAVAAIK
ncbi:RidA family protein [Phototrophicus methaneseepsis]|uniref:RidA family protein n=2 Tax=Phototrophicus methaneseepsis TaxID=2710758 RepID=A0A7S8EE19_9CHLR|nr:RidA family protein [Phototrophicus methaneseepsis]